MATSTLPGGLIAFGPDANCTLALCPLEASLLQYRPSLPASITFISVFGLSLLVHTAQGIRSKSWGFMSCMISGCIFEVVGYIGRIIINDNPFDFGGFLIQIICITVAPVFFCSAIYVLLSQVINLLDRSISRCDPRLFYWIFIPCDIVSLVLQATGGALSCIASTKADIDVGVDISLAGLIFQVVTLTIFFFLFADYMILCWRLGPREKLTRRLLFFLLFLSLSVLFILIRCVYRIVELHEGYFSELFREEVPFIVLESGIMSIGVICLNIGHPSLAFGRRGSKKMELDPTDSADSAYELTNRLAVSAALAVAEEQDTNDRRMERKWVSRGFVKNFRKL
ncbi:unnamed protein product [Clonostachys rosea f. rosea IK726]|uniref:Parasitic phase-specific protein PSP-1 n=2 Tax=Bionectria ochroleuca TaxID=29856 RepID=A0A0B7K5I5_BIOOC|nr:unnamed protein product [Clonostachys rosea f. rosea IK726]